jgi:hypothetical protein
MPRQRNSNFESLFRSSGQLLVTVAEQSSSSMARSNIERGGSPPLTRPMICSIQPLNTAEKAWHPPSREFNALDSPEAFFWDKRSA